MNSRTAPLMRIEAYLRRRGIEYTHFDDDGKGSINVRSNWEPDDDEPERRFVYFTDLGPRIEFFWGPYSQLWRPSWSRFDTGVPCMVEMDSHDEVLLLTRAREILCWLGWY